jgi:hypothetical protein
VNTEQEVPRREYTAEEKAAFLAKQTPEERAAYLERKKFYNRNKNQ